MWICPFPWFLLLLPWFRSPSERVYMTQELSTALPAPSSASLWPWSMWHWGDVEACHISDLKPFDGFSEFPVSFIIISFIFAYPSGFSLTLAIPNTSTSSFFCPTHSSLRVSSREYLPLPSWFTFNSSSLWTTPWCGMLSDTTALTSPYCDGWLPPLSLTTQGSFLDRA